MTKKYVVEIDVTPEVEDYRRNEYEIKTIEDAIKLRLSGAKLYEVAKILIASKKLGELEKDTLPEDKWLYENGVKVKYASIEASRMRMAKMPNGKELEVREFVASVDQVLDDTQSASVNGKELESVQLERDTHTSDDALLSSSDPAAVQRALDYLEIVVPGYVMGRLKIIAEHNGDYKKAAERLIEKVREMVKVIEEPSES